MSNNYQDEERTLDLPENIHLPFFAYGIFKPGQLAYSKIKNHVKCSDNVEIKYKMKHRDGVPILINKNGDYFATQGFIINFKEHREESAYTIISKTLLRKLYEWKTIEINGNEVNLVFGVNPDNGSVEIENKQDRENFDGKKDPFFKDALELIEENLNSKNKYHETKSFFELQMNYMLLWSAIDRFSTLKYNKKYQKWNNEKFSKEKAFQKGINKFKDNYHQPVFSTDDGKIHEFNANKPYQTLKYYYTFRCNVVHRGKAARGDYHMLETATKELLEIFKEIIKNTFY